MKRYTLTVRRNDPNAYLARDFKVGAIKTFRLLTGYGLIKAKDAIEDAIDGYHVQFDVTQLQFMHRIARANVEFSSIEGALADLDCKGFVVTDRFANEPDHREMYFNLINRLQNEIEQAVTERNYTFADKLLKILIDQQAEENQ